MTIAYTFGRRVNSEVLSLERRHLDVETGTLRLDPGVTKNDDGRVVYLTPELKALLSVQLERVDACRSGSAGSSPTSSRIHGRRVGQPRKDIRTVWTAACRKAGCPGMLVHDFRRTAVRNMEKGGVPRSVATKLTGHRTESIDRRCAIVSDADLRDAA
jgi:integrase